MAAKTKTITITVFGTPAAATSDGVEYQVERLTDSTNYQPGQFLKKKQVDELCAARDWKVTLIRPAK